MTAFIFLSILLYLLCCRPYRKDLFSTGEYMSMERTTMLNGIMIMFVFIRHSYGHIPSLSCFNEVDFVIRHFPKHVGQLIVAGFLFYSGFGIMLGIMRKGKDYLDKFPYHRFFKVLLRYDIAILCFWLMQESLGSHMSWDKVLFSLIAWTSLGNPCWYICVTLMLYVVTYLSFRWCGRFRWLAMWGSCLLLILFLYLTRGKMYWWYDTLLCFPAGMSFAASRTWVEGLLRKTRLPLPLLGALFMVIALVLQHRPTIFNPFVGNISAILFAYGAVLLLSRTAFRTSPRALTWMGGALFSIFIFHKIPMILIQRLTDWEKLPSLFIGVCLVATLLIVMVAERFYKWLDKLLFSPARR